MQTTTSANEAAYRHLKHQILTGELAPGQEVNEISLSEESKFGRTPVREALRRLVHDGYMEVRPRRGYRVSTVTVDTVRELFEMRALLEPAAVELAIERATDDELAGLHELAHTRHEFDDRAGYEKFLSDNRDLHVRLAELGGNARLAKALRQVLEEMQRLLFVIGGPNIAFEQPHEHEDLFDAIRARDAETSRKIVLDQIESSRQRVMRALVDGAAGRYRTTLGVVL